MNLNAKTKKTFYGLLIILPLFSTMLLAIRNQGKVIGKEWKKEKTFLDDTTLAKVQNDDVAHFANCTYIENLISIHQALIPLKNDLPTYGIDKDIDVNNVFKVWAKKVMVHGVKDELIKLHNFTKHHTDLNSIYSPIFDNLRDGIRDNGTCYK